MRTIIIIKNARTDNSEHLLMSRLIGALVAALLACAFAPLSAAAQGTNPCPRPDPGTPVAPPPDLISSNGVLNASFDYYTDRRQCRPDAVLLRDAGWPAIADIACAAGRHAQSFIDQSEPAAPTGITDRSRGECIGPLRRCDNDDHIGQCTFSRYQYLTDMPQRSTHRTVRAAFLHTAPTSDV
jgi:hypothetical protein